MKIGAMLGDILTSLFKRPVTERYPFERKQDPERLRGKLIWDPDKCSGCMLCVKDCPANAIELFVIDRANKRFVMRYNPDKCIYCAQCVMSCRSNAMSMANDQWELAQAKPEPFTIHYGKDEDIKELLASIARPGSGSRK
ncbi:MAG: 4Fe-4S binding protein [Anaerolineaceae bacterium]|nr:4Fe-4S binding protein [Anaerolineaceae bacterium]